VLMTIENTCPKCWWLTNALETMLVRTWYPSTVATLSRHTFENLAKHLKDTGCDGAGLPFMFHDFGARGASSHETAGLGGMAHIILSQGTDTMEGMQFALKYYEAVLDTLAFSVPATEHSVMTSLGPDGEYEIVSRLIDEHPTGVLSVVADSYNIYKFVTEIGTTFRNRILAREDGPFVVRPDSTTKEHPTPAKLMVDLTQSLWHYFGGTTNEAGYKVLDPHVRLLWGDGINPKDMNEILTACARAGFAAENYVFGMGGGLLQKVNRDTQRFAFKCSAQQRNGAWFNVQKSPLDQSKASKAGKFSLIQNKDGTFNTIPELSNDDQDLLEVVFENGKIVKEYTFDEIRQRAAIL
jgi:nicotinamide phosphoribosyltransferase